MSLLKIQNGNGKSALCLTALYLQMLVFEICLFAVCVMIPRETNCRPSWIRWIHPHSQKNICSLAGPLDIILLWTSWILAKCQFRARECHSTLPPYLSWYYHDMMMLRHVMRILPSFSSTTTTGKKGAESSSLANPNKKHGCIACHCPFFLLRLALFTTLPVTAEIQQEASKSKHIRAIETAERELL